MTCPTSIRSSGSTSPIGIVGVGEDPNSIFTVASGYFDANAVHIQAWLIPANGGAIGPEEPLFADVFTTDGFAPGAASGLGVGPDGDFYLLVLSSFDNTNDLFRIDQDGDVVDHDSFSPYSFEMSALTFNGIADRLLVCQRPGAWDSGSTELEVRVMSAGFSTLHTISLDPCDLLGGQFITTDDGRSWLPISDEDGFGFLVIDPLSGDYDIYHDLSVPSPTLTGYELDCTGLGIDYSLVGGT